MDITGLALLIGLGVSVGFWLSTLDAREQALAAARESCHKLGLQLLDATVSLHRVTPRRTAQGLALERTFQFAYSRDGDDRHTGFVITLGNRVEHVGL